MSASRANMTPLLRAGFLFINFFLIILAYYQVKPASRSLFLEYGNADLLPYVWISSALTLLVLMPVYQKLLQRYGRQQTVLGSCFIFICLLLSFRVLMLNANFEIAFAFYMLVDIFSVVLVEQLWSLVNSVYHTETGKRWYGLVASGGVLGGLVGGALAAALIKYTPLRTPDLLLVSAAMILLVFMLTLSLVRRGLYKEVDKTQGPVLLGDARNTWSLLTSSRYLLLIASLLLLAQLAQPIVDYQFMKLVGQNYMEQESRTAFLSTFFMLLGIFALMINLILAPVIQRSLGVVAGLLMQPLLLGAAAWLFVFNASMPMATIMKLFDRGLSYSINRVSKELLYVPIRPEIIYRAKAWIDMVGYRLFKILGSLIILLVTQWLPVTLDVAQMSWLVMGLCVAWVMAILVLRKDYNQLAKQELSALKTSDWRNATGVAETVKGTVMVSSPEIQRH